MGDLTGTAGAASGAFLGPGGAFDLKDGTSTQFNYSVAPTAHGDTAGSAGVHFADGSADGTNQAEDVTIKLDATGVGPTYQSSVSSGGILDFGQIQQGGSGFFDLKISNTSVDPGGESLTGLTLLGIKLGSGDFKLDSFIPGTVIDEGASLDLKIAFTGDVLGLENVDLLVTTDEDAAFGEAGDTFDYTLSADVVAPPPLSTTPEPASAVLMVSGAAGLAALRRRAKRR